MRGGVEGHMVRTMYVSIIRTADFSSPPPPVGKRRDSPDQRICHANLSFIPSCQFRVTWCCAATWTSRRCSGAACLSPSSCWCPARRSAAMARTRPRMSLGVGASGVNLNAGGEMKLTSEALPVPTPEAAPQRGARAGPAGGAEVAPADEGARTCGCSAAQESRGGCREPPSGRHVHARARGRSPSPTVSTGGGSVDDKNGAESKTPEERRDEQCAFVPAEATLLRRPRSGHLEDALGLASYLHPRSGHLEGGLSQGSGYSLPGYTGGLSVPSWHCMLPGSSAQRGAGASEVNPVARATVPSSTSVVAVNEVGFLSLQM